MPPQRLWQQYRQVKAGDVKATAKGDDDDIDMEISVGQSKDDENLNFEVSLWNISKATWRGISEGDPCEVTLGWYNSGPSPQSVCLGIINETHSKTDGPDRKYVLKGKDKSEAAFSHSFSRSWRNRSPDTIAKFIAGMADLDIGKVDSVGSPIEGIWAIKKRHPISHWLKKLTKEAGKKTDEQWEYYAQAGKFYFLKKKTQRDVAIDVNDDNAIKVDTSTGKTKKTSNGEEIDFTAYLDPRLTKDSLLNISSPDVDGIYKVSEYDFSSSTDNGDHLMSGTAVPTEAEYRVKYDKAPRGAVRAYRRSAGR